MSIPEAEAILGSYVRIFPHADVHTHAPWGNEIHWGNPWAGGQNCDHFAIGTAAIALKERGAFSGNLYLYIEPYNVIPFEGTKGKGHLKTILPTSEDKDSLERAVEAYKNWDPPHGRFAIGYHSVTGEFDDFLDKPASFLWQSARDSQ